MRIGLWLKLTAAFVFAALVPVGTTAWITRQTMGSRYEREHKRSLREIESLTQQQVDQAYAAIARKVTRFARDDDPKIGRVLVELARGKLPPDLRRELNVEGPQRMRHLGFDVLLIVGPKGRILSSGHAPGRVGLKDPLPGRLAAKRAGQPAIVRLPFEVKRGSKIAIEQRPAIVVAVKVRGPGTHVVVLGGMELERAIWSRLQRKPGVAYQLEDMQGKVWKTPAEGWARWKNFTYRLIPLPGPGGKPVAQIRVAVSDEELRLSRQRLDLVIMILAGSAFLFVVLVLGALVIRRFTGRLGKVAAAAEAVAGGDLTVTLPPGPHDEVGDLVRAFNQMTGNLADARDRLVRAERIAAWQEIARRIAHEIKNPLTPIQLSIETLRRAYQAKRDDYDEIMDESTTTILEEVQRLRRIVTEFSEFARMPKPQLGPCELNETIRVAASLYDGEALELTLDLAEDLPEVQADREQIMQVLHNLLANARDAVSGVENPAVSLQSFIYADGESVGFTVCDNGHGFDDEIRQQLFTPYYTTKASSGTGLGLAIVHRIVVEHGGAVEVSGAPDEGATMTVRLPIEPTQPDSD